MAELVEDGSVQDHDQRLTSLITVQFPALIELLREPSLSNNLDLKRMTWLDKEIYLHPPTGEKVVLDLVCQTRVQQPVDPTPEAPLVWCDGLAFVEVHGDDSTTRLERRLPNCYRGLRHDSDGPVLPIVVYQNVCRKGRGWEHMTEYFATFRVGSVSYVYLGLPGLDAWEHVNGPNILGVALCGFMRIAPGQRPAVKALALQRIATSGENEMAKFLLAECVEAYLTLEGEEQAEFERLMALVERKEAAMIAKTSYDKGLEAGREEVKTAVATAARTSYDKGLEAGREEAMTSFEKGLEKVREEARDGQYRLIERLLQRKFGLLPEDARRRLRAISAEQLGNLLDGVLAGSRLRGLGLTD